MPCARASEGAGHARGRGVAEEAESGVPGRGRGGGTHPGLYSITADRFSQDLDRSVMDRLSVDSRPL